MSSKVLIIGAGAAGMMAAYAAAKNGASVSVLEKNLKPGRKMAITGKGRCNITNDCERDAFFDNIVTNPRFMFSAYSRLKPQDVMSLLTEDGLKIKVERGNRVFPESDKAFDVVDSFFRLAKKAGARFFFGVEVVSVKKNEGGFSVVAKTAEGARTYTADKLIIATGGNSYEATGSTGDGYRFAESFTHKVNEVRPALIPLRTKETWPREIMGLSLKNVQLNVFVEGKKVYSDLGEMLFTHFGISGPLVLSASSFMQAELFRLGRNYENAKCQVVLDLKPALDEATLDARLIRELEAAPKANLTTVLRTLLPSELANRFPKLCGVAGDKKTSEVSRQDREAIGKALKGLTLTIADTLPLNEAIITQGGLEVTEIDPSSCESKKVKGLYFAGELLDVDALTGGFNLQIAYSTGYLAGLNAAKGE